MEEEIKYTILIPTFNRSKSLLNALDSVCDQTINKEIYEIVIVNDGSTDDTRDVIMNFAKNHSEYKLKYLYQKNSGCARARNNGILRAKGEIIFFTDDDCVVPQNWMEKILEAFKKYPEAVGVGGWYEPTDEVFKKNKYYQFERFFMRQGYPEMENCEIYSNTRKSPVGNTANMAYKKSALIEAGLFDEKINFTGCVDWELKIRMTLGMRYPLAYIPLIVEHRKTLTSKLFFLKSFNQSRGRDYCQMKFSDLRKDPYYYQTLKTIFRDIKVWTYNPKKRPFAGIYFIHIFYCLLGKYFNRINDFKCSEELKSKKSSEKKFLQIFQPDGKMIKKVFN
jgi:glycosyltransferase involved in cell wall biosynthesis